MASRHTNYAPHKKRKWKHRKEGEYEKGKRGDMREKWVTGVGGKGQKGRAR